MQGKGFIETYHREGARLLVNIEQNKGKLGKLDYMIDLRGTMKAKQSKAKLKLKRDIRIVYYS